MKLTINNRTKYLVLFYILLAFSIVEPAFAKTLGELGENAGKNAEGLADGVKSIAYLIGFVMIIGSLIAFSQAKKTNSPISIPAIAFVIGVLLVSVLGLISVGSESIFGSDESDKATKLLKL